ncbi:MAG: DUF4351 domain-containing protein [Acaryochloridaceae cyanobacterium RL_2_7]|nr:DUF4351 domain-containing protein [Acaryochloridaceae cyanobacterium RL_2_7]
MQQSVIYQEWREEFLAKGRQEGLQEGRQEGLQEGRQEEGRSLILRQLTRRFGVLAPEMRSQIESLSLPQLENLGEALLDFRH